MTTHKIELIGYDDSTEVEFDMNKAEYDMLIRLVKKINKASECAYQPIILVDKRYLEEGEEEW